MRDYLSIGCSPANEPCAQVGSPNYREQAMKECHAFIRQLRRMHGEEPEGAQLFVKAESHDFGTYHEVHCRYDDDYPEAVEYAFKCEGESPEEWDAEAKRELLWSPVKGNVMTDAHIQDKIKNA